MLARSRLGPPWRRPARAVLAMPLAFSIANGLALGFITFPLVKLLAGRSREVSALAWVLAVLFLLRYLFLGAG